MHSQLRWSRCIVRMDVRRLPKAVFYSQLTSGIRPLHHPFKRYNDGLKSNLKHYDIDSTSWDQQP